MEIVVNLPQPHDKQLSFLESTAKRQVVVSGRRAGKTTGVSIKAAEALLDGRRVLYAAPTLDQTEVFWANEKRYFRELINRGVMHKNETQRALELGEGRIRAKTAWDADSLRGDYADLLILEEFSLMDRSTWDEVGAPMLLDNDGDAIFIGTPKRKNHFHHFHVRAKADGERWQSWHFTSLDNPHLSTQALEEITQDMTEEAYRQEIMAEFLENEGTVFRNIGACLSAAKDAKPEDHQGHRLVMGVDWGKQSDFTALSVMCSDCRQELALDRFNQIDYAFQRQRLEVLAKKWAVSFILAEVNAMGEPLVEELQRQGLPVQGFTTTAASKPPLIESLALAFERAEAQWLDISIATSELEAYERKVSQATGRSAYSAPEGLHDDTVIARALAWRAALQVPAELKQHVNPFYA